MKAASAPRRPRPAPPDALADELAALRALLSQSPHPTVRLDAAGRPLYANPAARTLDASLTRAERLQARRQLRAAARGEAAGTLRIGLGERQFQLHIVSGAPPPADGTTIYLADITAQVATTEALARREKQYRDLMTYSQALICTHDLGGRLLSLNPAAVELLSEVPAAEPFRSYLTKLTNSTELADLANLAELTDLAPPEHRAGVATYLARMAETGSQRGVVAVRMAAGTRYILYDNHLVREPGQPPYVIGYGQDITERVRTDQAHKQAKAAAETAVRARESFLANVSHEIRTPLNGVLGLAGQLAKTPLDARQQDYVRTIRQTGQHLLRVVGDVLDLAKMTAGKLSFEVVPFNLCDSLAESLGPLAAQALDKGLYLTSTPLRASCPYPWVLGDPYRLNQIVINLVANAIKFTEPGGHVTVMAEQVAETADSLSIRFRVTDTGIGIAPEKQELIFESFSQAYADTGRRFGGTGLGLSISHALTAQLGGQLLVHSELGQGSTFVFRLTLPKAPVPNPALIPAPAEAAGAPGDYPAADPYDTGALRGRRLLLVEDNELNRIVARLLLEGWGASVDEAETGPEALALVRANAPYDAVLMDLRLPGLSGLDTTAAIRALPDAARACQPVIALTASADPTDAARALAAGLDACLSKPFDEALLFRTLADLLPAPGARPAAPAPEPAAGPAYDLTKLRGLAQGRQEFVGKIIDSFLRNMPASLAQLAEAAAAGHWVETANLTHHIRPSLESVGVPDVAEAVRLLEAARPEDFAHLPAAAAQLLAQARYALAALPHEIGE